MSRHLVPWNPDLFRPVLWLTSDQMRELTETGRCGPGPSSRCPICSSEIQRHGTEVIDRVVRMVDGVARESREASSRFWPCGCEGRELL